MNRVKKITSPVFAVLLVGFVALLVANEALYKHTHQINGHVVTHAHPYSTSPDSSSSNAPAHQHSKAEVAFWENMEVLFTVAIGLAFIMLHTPQPVLRGIQPVIPVYPAPQITHQGRAPPAS
jgi:hypothetical protein